MSFDIRTIRQPSRDPLQKFVNHIARAVSKNAVERLVEQLDDSEDIFTATQNVSAAIKFQTDLNSNHVFSFNKDYYTPIDADYLTCWIRGRGMAVTTRDYSEAGNRGQISGEPILVNGAPFDDLIEDGNVGVPSRALRFNRTTSPGYNTEYIRVPENTNLQITGLATGFSIFIRFRVQSLEMTDPVGGGDARNTTLCQKIDDSTPNNAFMIQVQTDGALRAIVKHGGVTTAKVTDIGIIQPNVVYDVWVTFAVGGPTIKIYVDNGELPTSNFTGGINWQEDLTNHDLWLMNRGYLSGGFTHGDLYDFKFYQQEKIVSLTEIQNHFTNKLSISPIPAGQVRVTNHWAFNTGGGAGTGRVTLTNIYRYDIAGTIAELAGYTSTGYTSEGYTV